MCARLVAVDCVIRNVLIVVIVVACCCYVVDAVVDCALVILRCVSSVVCC